MQKRYDLAVIGAGPAGSLCAALAAEAGLQVALFEKEALPREKPCGGLVSPRARALLPPAFKVPQELCSPVKLVRIHGRGRSSEAPLGNPAGLVVRRAEFDLLLARFAKQCGASLFEATPLAGLECLSDGYLLQCGPGGSGQSRIHARYVVGADGAWSTCARLAGLPRPGFAYPQAWGCTMSVPRVKAAGEERAVEFYPLPLRVGLGWAFYGRDWVNRGVGGLGGPSLLKRELSRLFSPLPAGTRIYTWPLPFTGPLRRAWRENLLLVGDAAGLVETFSGEGIYHALKSARLAVSAVLVSIDQGVTAGSVYARLFRDQFTANYHRSILGALALLARSALAPGTLPGFITAVMHNSCWFNRQLAKEENGALETEKVRS